MKSAVRVAVLVAVGTTAFGGRFEAQDRIDKMPGVAEFKKMQAALQGGAFVSGAITQSWTDNAAAFTYTHAGMRYRFDVATLTAVSEGPAPAAAGPGRGGRAGGPPAAG